nr:immunoglobulin heavy chain junction region [Mus musculus]
CARRQPYYFDYW